VNVGMASTASQQTIISNSVSWKQMATIVGIQKDITNKSGRVTSITQMAMAQVPPEVMALTTGHRNLKTLGRYDRSVYLKHFPA
jgi:hypothetical protein